jgi:hypothetical protein
VEWLIDTGASPNLLDIGVFQALPEATRKPLDSTDLRLFGANGSALEVYGNSSVDVVVEEERYNVPVVVANLEGAQGILGMSFLTDNSCSLDVCRGHLDCRDAQHQLHKLRREGYSRVSLTEPLRIAVGRAVVAKGVLDEEIVDAVGMSGGSRF